MEIIEEIIYLLVDIYLPTYITNKNSLGVYLLDPWTTVYDRSENAKSTLGRFGKCVRVFACIGTIWTLTSEFLFFNKRVLAISLELSDTIFQFNITLYTNESTKIHLLLKPNCTGNFTITNGQIPTNVNW